MKRNLPPDSVLLVMDFAKNRTVRYQDEAKSVYFTARQITIHPVVAFYHSPDFPDLIVRNSLVFLSDDNKHDYNAVDHFFVKSIQYLKKEGIPFSEVIVFSDGCAAQYKGKGSFADLSLKNIKIQRNFFGSDHGKSECDGEVGCINRAVDMAILGRKTVVADAEDLYTWCSTSNLCLNEAGSKRRFFLVKSGDITRDREMDVTTLRGCRKLHQMFNIPSSPYKLMVKKLSCYCTNCRNGQTDDCPNRAYTGAYEPRTLQPTRSKATGRSQAEKTTRPSTPETTGCSQDETTNSSLSDITNSSKSDTTKNSKSETTESVKSKSTRSSRSETRSSNSEKTGGSKSATARSLRSETRSSKSEVAGSSKSKTAANSKSETTKSKSTKSLQSETTRQSPSQQLWTNVSSCQTYDDLQHILATTELEPLPQQPEVTFLTHKRIIDESALGLIPDDLQTRGLYPSIVYGDGNCLPRCASLLVYGHEDNHFEMRGRIVDELVRHEEDYLDNKILTKGSHPSAHDNIAVQFAMFSEYYSNEKLTDVAVHRIFRAEVLEMCRSGKYMGSWQIAALANVK